MKPAPLKDLKKDLYSKDVNQLVDICLRMAKFKKENKELLSYLLFDGLDEYEYRKLVKEQLDQQFEEMPKLSLYLMGKSIRKVLKYCNKQIRFSGNKQSEVEILLHFLGCLKGVGISVNSSIAMRKMIETQLKKIHNAIESLHEDLQYDYQMELSKLAI